jgi:proliferating cell nuclear antigen PCNA
MRLNIEQSNKSTIFSTILKQLKSFTSDINIRFYKENFYIQFLDNNNICLCEVSLKNEWFDTYIVNDEELIGLNTEILQKIIKCKNDGDNIEINFHNNDDKIHFSFNNYNNDNSITKNFEVPLIDIDTQLIDVPNNTESQADIKFMSSTFFHLINELAMFSNILEFDVNETEIIMNSSGDQGKYCINVDIDKVEEFSIEEDAIINQSFSLRYFTLISSLSKISDYVNISIGENSPMIIMFNLDEVNNSDIVSVSSEENEEDEDEDEDEEINQPNNFVRFFLAPIVSNI